MFRPKLILINLAYADVSLVLPVALSWNQRQDSRQVADWAKRTAHAQSAKAVWKPRVVIMFQKDSQVEYVFCIILQPVHCGVLWMFLNHHDNHN